MNVNLKSLENSDNEQSLNQQWFIITPNFKRGKCENPKAPNCKNSDKLLWIKSVKKPKLFTNGKFYVCGECAKRDFKLVGLWANTWEKDFKNE